MSHNRSLSNYREQASRTETYVVRLHNAHFLCVWHKNRDKDFRDGSTTAIQSTYLRAWSRDQNYSDKDTALM